MTDERKALAPEAGTPEPGGPIPDPSTPEGEYEAALAALPEPKQRLFVQAYLLERNATKAAKTAGYSRHSARQIGGENLRKPDIRRAIEAGFRLALMGPQEVMGLLTDVARGTPEDLFTFETVEHTPRVQRFVRDLLAELRDEIAFEQDFGRRAALEGEEWDAHQARVRGLQRQALRMEMELERQPNLKRWVYGEPVARREARLDLDKMRAAGKFHLIREVKPTRYGLGVKTYDMVEAAVHIGKAHGLWREDDEGGEDTSGLEELVRVMAERKRQRDEERGRG